MEVAGKVELLQAEPVELLPGGQNSWKLTVTLPNAHAFYALLLPGNYSVKAVIPMRTYLGIDHPNVGGVDYSELDRFDVTGAIESNPEHFTILADADIDGYYVPEGWPLGSLPDCNDNNLDVNPGKQEIGCNGVDDDCNPTTIDFPLPTLASPSNGATNVSITPTFGWSGPNCDPRYSVTSYRLQVATDASFLSIVVDQSGIGGTLYTLGVPLSANTIYYWRVKAMNSQASSDWSAYRNFTTSTTGKAYLLTVKKAGTGSGNVDVSPGTLLTGMVISGTATYAADTTVTLTATANAGSIYECWFTSLVQGRDFARLG